MPFIHPVMAYSIKPAHPSPSRKVREGLAHVISMHEMLTNQILLFHFEPVAASVCKTNTGAVLGL